MAARSLDRVVLRLAVVAAAVLLWTAVSHAADPPLLITLKLGRNHTLPGIPVSLQFTAFNRASQPVEMLDVFALEIIPPDGAPFLGFWPDPRYRWAGLPIEYENDWLIPPQQSREFLMALGDHMTSPAALVTDPMFIPGVYRLRAGFLPTLQGDTAAVLEASHTIQELEARLPGVISTNEVTLRIDAPTGDDLAVWNLILERSGGEGWIGMIDIRKRSALAREVWDRYPRSQYAPHMIGVLVPKAGESRAMIRDRIQSLDPRHPMLDWFDLGQAQRHALEAGDAVSAERDLTKSLRLAQQARDEIAALSRRTQNDVIRRAAQRITVWSDDSILRADRVYSRSDPPPPPASKPVQPFVSCSKETGNSLLVVWGYENPNTYPVTLKIGSDNQFSPAAADRGQPTTFLPGRHDEVLTTTIDAREKDDGHAITWTLGGQTARAGKETDRR